MTDARSEMVNFTANGGKVDGYLALPEGGGPFPGVIVIQEWWGLNDHIKDIADRFAREGFAALAPDLYHGEVAKEPDEAMKKMMALDMPRASRELVKAVDYLAARPEVQGRRIGSVGFCMGGGLALTLACDSPKIKASAPFYGINPDPISKLGALQGPVSAMYAEHDDWCGPAVQQALRDGMKEYGKQLDFKVYPGAQHGFFNDTRAGQHDPAASKDAWERTLKLFRENL